jgi:uncharacterized membrane protein YuzA (DUF378 family)
MKRSAVRNIKTALIVVAAAIWGYIAYSTFDLIASSREALTSYILGTAIALAVIYVLMLAMELFIDVEDLD